MCSTITVYAGCNHTHMQKTGCKQKRNSLFCFPSSSKSKTCLDVIRKQSPGLCRICLENDDRKKRKVEARARQSRNNRDSFIDPALNREFAQVPQFALQTPQAAVVRQPPTQAQRPECFDDTVPMTSPQRARVLDWVHGVAHPHPLPPLPSASRPRVDPSIPSLSTIIHARDGSVSPVVSGFMDPRAVSPDVEHGRGSRYYASRR